MLNLQHFHFVGLSLLCINLHSLSLSVLLLLVMVGLLLVFRLSVCVHGMQMFKFFFFFFFLTAGHLCFRYCSWHQPAMNHKKNNRSDKSSVTTFVWQSKAEHVTVHPPPHINIPTSASTSMHSSIHLPWKGTFIPTCLALQDFFIYFLFCTYTKMFGSMWRDYGCGTHLFPGPGIFITLLVR